MGNHTLRLHTATALLAILTILPWVLYVIGIAKITEIVTDDDQSYFNQALRMPVVMLEWYTVAAQFLIIVLLAVFGFTRLYKRTGTFLIGWLMCNTAIIIIRTTIRIQQINLIEDGDMLALSTSCDQFPATIDYGEIKRWLQCEAVGMIVTAGMNYIITITLGIAAGGEAVVSAKPAPPVAA